eukprot:g7127.t1
MAVPYAPSIAATPAPARYVPADAIPAGNNEERQLQLLFLAGLAEAKCAAMRAISAEIQRKKNEIQIALHRLRFEEGAEASEGYVVMLKVQSDQALMRLGRELKFPRGCPMLWFPKTKRILAYGFYPKFAASNTIAAAGGSKKGQAKRNKDSEAGVTTDCDRLVVVRKYSGFLSMLLCWRGDSIGQSIGGNGDRLAETEKEKQYFYTVTSKNSADVKSSRFLPIAKALWDHELGKDLIETLADARLCLSAEVMSRQDEVHGAKVLKDALVVTGLTHCANDDSAEAAELAKPATLMEVYRFCAQFGLPCQKPIVVAGADVRGFLERLRQKKDFLTDEGFSRYVASEDASTSAAHGEDLRRKDEERAVESIGDLAAAEVPPTEDALANVKDDETKANLALGSTAARSRPNHVSHSEILGDVLEGVVLLYYRRNDGDGEKEAPLSSSAVETAVDNSFRLVHMEKEKFPNYMCRIALREWLTRNPTLISQPVFRKVETWLDSWTNSEQGRKYWRGWLLRAALEWETKRADRGTVTGSGKHIELADRITEQFFQGETQKALAEIPLANGDGHGPQEVLEPAAKKRKLVAHSSATFDDYQLRLRAKTVAAIVVVLGPVGFGKSTVGRYLEKTYPDRFRHIDGDDLGLVDADGSGLSLDDVAEKLKAERQELTFFRLFEAIWRDGRTPVLSVGGGVLYDSSPANQKGHGQQHLQSLRLRSWMRAVFPGKEVFVVALLPGPKLEKEYANRKPVEACVRARCARGEWRGGGEKDASGHRPAADENFVRKICELSGKNVTFAVRLQKHDADEVMWYQRVTYEDVVRGGAQQDSSSASAPGWVPQGSIDCAKLAEWSARYNSLSGDQKEPNRPGVAHLPRFHQTRALAYVPHAMNRFGHVTLQFGEHCYPEGLRSDDRLPWKNGSKVVLRGTHIRFPKHHALSFVLVWYGDWAVGGINNSGRRSLFGHVTIESGPHPPGRIAELSRKVADRMRGGKSGSEVEKTEQESVVTLDGEVYDVGKEMLSSEVRVDVYAVFGVASTATCPLLAADAAPAALNDLPEAWSRVTHLLAGTANTK